MMNSITINKRFFIYLLASLFCLSATCKDFVKKELKRIDGKLYVSYLGRKELSLVNERVVTVKLKSHAELDKDIIPIRSNRLGYIDLSVPQGVDVVEFVRDLEDSNKYDMVKYATIAKACLSPNDSDIANQWYLSAINMFDAWNITMGYSSVKVAVLDLEVDWNHKDLGYGTDGYRNIDWQNGFNYLSNSNSSYLPRVHGTMVAGIIGAKANNQEGIAGISGGNHASGVTIIPYGIGIETDSVGIDFTVVDDAIIDAVDKGVKVINMSFTSFSFYHPDIDDAIEYAYENGVTLIAATGNEYTNTIYYPASHSFVIAVGATNQNSHRCDFSDYGIGLDLVAPGKDIYSTTTQNGYNSDDGTSFAAPQVSGVAALMLSVNPSLTPSAIKQILVGTCQKLTNTYTFNNNGWNNEVGYGLVNAYAAVCTAKASMTGSTVLCNSNVYSISNLPTGASVIWSLASGNTLCVSLQSNNPSTNQCTLSLTNSSGFNSVTLKADIIMNGMTVKSLQKVINKAVPFSGTYEQMGCSDYGFTTPAITPTTIPSNHTMTVYVGGIVTLTSNYFKLKDVTTSGPYGNFYYAGGNQIRFTLTPANVSQALVITIHEEGCDDEVQLTFYAYPIQNFNLSITPQDSKTFELSLTREKVGRSEQVNEPWTLEVTNAATGRKALTKEMDAPAFILHTEGWEPGVYVVRALVGKEPLTGKVTVR